ncbi:MAG TPA: universal stress protein [Usitatibacter sp.]|nr:universal stress protein [Usitatibacter sp.]
MAARFAPAHVALFPPAVRNVLVVANRLQDPRSIAAKLARMHREEPVRIYLLAVVPAPTGHAMAFLRGIDVKRVLREDGLKLLRPLRDGLDAAGVPYRHDVEVGRWEETIAAYARERCCKSILIGDHDIRDTRRLAHLLLRHDAWRIRTRLIRSGFACEML